MRTKRSAGLEKLLEEYRQSLPSKRAEILEAWDQAADAGWSGDPFQTLITRVHQLAGSAGSYGFPELSAAARTLDRQLADVKAGDADFDEELARERLDILLERFKAEDSR